LGEFIFFALKENEPKERPLWSIVGSADALRYSKINGRCGTHLLKILNLQKAQTILATTYRYFSPLLGDSQENKTKHSVAKSWHT